MLQLITPATYSAFPDAMSTISIEASAQSTICQITKPGSQMNRESRQTERRWDSDCSRGLLRERQWCWPAQSGRFST